MPKPDSSPSAIVVSGGKQYRVALGDRILVDRIAAEPGSSVKLGVMLFSDGNDVKVGKPAVDGVDVDARVLAHRRGPRVESLRYKSKKRVRVHRGGRSYLTALEIIAVGGVGLATEEESTEQAKPEGRGRKPAPKKKATRPRAAAPVEQEPAEGTEEKTPAKKTTRRRNKKEDE